MQTSRSLFSTHFASWKLLSYLPYNILGKYMLGETFLPRAIKFFFFFFCLIDFTSIANIVFLSRNCALPYHHMFLLFCSLFFVRCGELSSTLRQKRQKQVITGSPKGPRIEFNLSQLYFHCDTCSVFES